MQNFVAATNNEKKLTEIRDILKSVGYGVMSLGESGIDTEIDEDGKTFMENALIKARTIHEMTKKATVADDSGLVVDALGGLPGVKTARYAGDGADDEQNIDKLLLALENVEFENRTARFVSAIAAVMQGGEEICTCGICEGYISFERRGENGFGYDPVFLFLSNNRSFAEMGKEEKNIISHRARALRKFAFLMRKIKRIRIKGYEI